jgi:hypothetical protein
VLDNRHEMRDRERIHSPLNVADGLPMHPHQFSEALLRQPRAKPRVADVSAQASQGFSFCHTAQASQMQKPLTPRIRSIKNSTVSARNPVIHERLRGNRAKPPVQGGLPDVHHSDQGSAPFLEPAYANSYQLSASQPGWQLNKTQELETELP